LGYGNSVHVLACVASTHACIHLICAARSISHVHVYEMLFFIL